MSVLRTITYLGATRKEMPRGTGIDPQRRAIRAVSTMLCLIRVLPTFPDTEEVPDASPAPAAQRCPRDCDPRRLSVRRAGRRRLLYQERAVRRADDLLRPAEGPTGCARLHRRPRRSDRPDRRSGRQAARRAETEDQARRHLSRVAVPLSLRDDAPDVRADDVPGRLLHDRGRGADGRQPGRQDLARARRQGPEVRGQHQARVQGGGRQGVPLELEPRRTREPRRHLPPQREEEDRAHRRQVHAQADDEDRRREEGASR